MPTSDIRGSLPPPLDLALPKHNLLPPPPMPLYNPFPYPSLSLLKPTLFPAPQAPSPPLISPLLLGANDPASICEGAAQLLFMNVTWAKSIPSFSELSLEDRILLLEESWKDLFVLGSAQFLYPINLNILLDRNNTRINKKDAEMYEAAVMEIAKIHPDANEYACLRAILLFRTCIKDQNGSSSPSNVITGQRKLQNVAKVGHVQDQSTVVLNEVRLIYFIINIVEYLHLKIKTIFHFGE